MSMNIADMQRLFNAQKDLQLDCYPKFLIDNTQEQRLQDNLKHIMHEAMEVERETNFKHWKQPVEVNWDKVKDELVDVFIFFMNACNESHLTVLDLYSRTIDKQKINRQRQKDKY